MLMSLLLNGGMIFSDFKVMYAHDRAEMFKVEWISIILTHHLATASIHTTSGFILMLAPTGLGLGLTLSFKISCFPPFLTLSIPSF